MNYLKSRRYYLCVCMCVYEKQKKIEEREDGFIKVMRNNEKHKGFMVE